MLPCCRPHARNSLVLPNFVSRSTWRFLSARISAFRATSLAVALLRALKGTSIPVKLSSFFPYRALFVSDYPATRKKTARDKKGHPETRTEKNIKAMEEKLARIHMLF